ncbi:MAG: DNA polymerase III subunit gamma/tau [Alcanivoracaceae bacterium]|nr:DNA polymerase III subunit gamma/tau [Alcanivoracaceae bacterium]
MSYQALARQFRPQNFTELVGQEHVSQALMNGLEQGRVHHAFLFTGTRGVGKTTVARILAKAFNCEKGVTGDPCGQCKACTEISEGRFVDLVEVDAASRTGVDDTRELLENVQYAPTSGRYKIYLIDEVHMFSNSSFNALLKTLEEPPPHVKFLLATTEPKKLPVTVLSRCLQFNLKRLSLPQIKGHLQKLLKIQSVEFEDSALELIARAADGSMRDGLSLLDQSLAFGAGSVKENDVKIMLGTMDQNSVVNLLNSIISKDSESLSAHLKQIFEMAPDYARFLSDMALLLHEVSLLQILNSYVDSSQFDRATINTIVKSTSAEQIQLYYQIVIKGQEEINLAPDSKIGFEMTIIRMFAFKIGQPGDLNRNNSQTISQSNTTTSINSVRQNSSPAAMSTTHNINTLKPPQSPVPEAMVQSEPVAVKKYHLKDITEQNWGNIFTQLQLKGTARELARNAHIISNNNGVLVLAIDKQAHAFMTDNAQQKLKVAIENVVTEQISIKLEQDVQVEKTIARTEQIQRDTKVRETKDKVQQNPFVHHMQNNFDAEVIQIKQGQNFLEV